MHINLYRIVKSSFALAHFNFLRLRQTNVTLRKRVLHEACFFIWVPVENDFLSVDDVCVAAKLAHFGLQITVEVTIAVRSIPILLTIDAATL